MTHSNGPITNLDLNQAEPFKRTNQKPAWKRGWPIQRVIISLTFCLTWSIITFLHLVKNEDVLARQPLITKRMLRPFHVTDSYWSISTRKAVIGQLLKGWQEIVSLSDTCMTWRRVQASREPRFHPGFWLVRLNLSASFPSRFLIGPFDMGQPCFHPGFWLVRLNESRGILDNRYCVISIPSLWLVHLKNPALWLALCRR